MFGWFEARRSTRFVEEQRVERGTVTLDGAQVQRLDSDRARQDRVVGRVDRAQATLAEPLLQGVAADMADRQAIAPTRSIAGGCPDAAASVDRRIGGAVDGRGLCRRSAGSRVRAGCRGIHATELRRCPAARDKKRGWMPCG